MSVRTVLNLERELQGILDAVSSAAADGNVEVRFHGVGHPRGSAARLRTTGFTWCTSSAAADQA
jgi:hypothetical protein